MIATSSAPAAASAQAGFQDREFDLRFPKSEQRDCGYVFKESRQRFQTLFCNQLSSGFFDAFGEPRKIIL